MRVYCITFIVFVHKSCSFIGIIDEMHGIFHAW